MMLLTFALFFVSGGILGLLDEGEFAGELEAAAETSTSFLLGRRPGLEPGQSESGMGTGLGSSYPVVDFVRLLISAGELDIS